jgi:hypothetical protein
MTQANEREYRVLSIRPSDPPARLPGEWRPMYYLPAETRVFIVFSRKAPRRRSVRGNQPK